MKLRRIRIYLIPLILLLVISPACSKSPEDQAVTKLIEKASRLVGEAVALRDENPGEADQLESEALTLLDVASFNYQSSSIVSELAEGEILIGPYPISELRELVAARIEVEEDDAEEVEEIELDPLRRAGQLALEPGPPYLKVIVLALLADKYRETDDSGRASELMALALSTAETIEKDYFKSRAMVIISQEYNQLGEEKLALEILGNARELAEGIKYPYFQSGAMAEIVGCCLKVGKHEEALQIVEKMEDPYFQADSLIEISGDFIDADNRNEAIMLLTRAEMISGEIDIPHFRAEVLAELALRSADAGEGGKASVLLVRAYELVDSVVDLVSRSEALVIIGRCYAGLGEEERAVELLSLANASAAAIENNLFKDQILQKIAEQYIVMGKYELAFGIEETIEDPRSKALILASLAESYDSSGNKEESEVLVNRTLEAIDNINNPLFQAEALIKIANLYQPPESPDVEILKEDQAPAPELSRSPSE